MGLITGVGFVPLLDNVTKRLAFEQFTNTDSVMSIIKEEYKMIRNVWRTYSQIESAIEQTGWIFSYVNFKNEQNTLRVCIFHPSVNKENYIIYEVGYPVMILPIELDSKTGNAIYDPIKQKIKVPKDESEIQSSIDQNVAIVVDLISALQPFCASISSRFQVGIHRDGQVGVSEIIDIQEHGRNRFDIKMNDNQ